MAKPSFSTLTVALTAVVVSSIVAAAGLTIAQTGQPPDNITIVDDLDAAKGFAFSYAGTNRVERNVGFRGHSLVGGYWRANQSANHLQAAFPFTDVPAGEFEFFATWPAHNANVPPVFETRVTYFLRDGDAITPGALVDQRNGPSGRDLLGDGTLWQSIGRITTNGGRINVILAPLPPVDENKTAHQIIADAVAMVRVGGGGGGGAVCGNGISEGSEQCDGGICCDSNCTLKAGGTECRAAAGTCDVAEACNGTSATCPADAFASATTVCRAVAGVCDAAENCSGNSGDCPDDAKKASGAVCTADDNLCTSDRCDGTTNTCQHPAVDDGAVCSPTGTCQNGICGDGGGGGAAPPKLFIAQKGLASWDTAVPGERDLTMLSFEARVTGQPVTLTSVVFDGASEDITNPLSNFENFSLWADTDGDNRVDVRIESDVAPADNVVRFERLANGGVILPAEDDAGSTRFEVRADVVDSPVEGSAMLRFGHDRVGPNLTVGARRETGEPLQEVGVNTNEDLCPTCDIIVVTTNSTVWRIAAGGGSLFVTKDTMPIRSRQLLGGNLGDAILRMQFRAENEDMTVQALHISSLDSRALSVDRLELFREGEIAPFTSATRGACSADVQNGKTFCAEADELFIVPKDANAVIIVRPLMKTDVAGAVSGESIQFGLKNEGGAVRVKRGNVYIGQSSIGGTARDIVGEKHVTVLSKIASIVNANPDANGSMVPTGYAPIGQFKFVAESNRNYLNGINNVVLSDVIFTIAAHNVQFNGSGFHLFNKADATQRATCRVIDITLGTLSVACQDLHGSTVNTRVPSGGSVVFVLEGTVTNAMVNPSLPSVLQVSLERFNDRSAAEFSVNGSHVRWLDTDTEQTEYRWFEYPETVVRSTKYEMGGGGGGSGGGGFGGGSQGGGAGGGGGFESYFGAPSQTAPTTRPQWDDGAGAEFRGMESGDLGAPVQRYYAPQDGGGSMGGGGYGAEPVREAAPPPSPVPSWFPSWVPWFGGEASPNEPQTFPYPDSGETPAY